MELLFENKKIKIKVIFYDSMIKLEGKYYLDKLPANAAKSPMKYRKLKSGKVVAQAVFFIPNGFVFDALRIDDEKTKQAVCDWLENTISDIAQQRGIEQLNTEE